MNANQLSNVLTLLSIDGSDTEKIKVIEILFGIVESAICVKVGAKEVPKLLEWMATEVVVKRYQLIGAEHLEAESIDVISSTFKSGDFLEEYEDFIEDYLSKFDAEGEPVEDPTITGEHKMRVL